MTNKLVGIEFRWAMCWKSENATSAFRAEIYDDGFWFKASIMSITVIDDDLLSTLPFVYTIFVRMDGSIHAFSPTFIV